jgi:uncharacterized membrane protein (DUF4010 family)
MEITLLHRLGIAVGLGLLVGLQRERASAVMAGIRTFPLIVILGLLCGWLGRSQGGWIVAAGLVAVAALTVVANLLRREASEHPDAGMTTEVAVLVMFLVGALLAMDVVLEAVVAAAGVALLLHWKRPLHEFADRLGAADFAAIMRLALLTLVILPVLPNRDFGPYAVLNPFEIWLMVVLIVGISMGGYVAFKLFGEKGGAVAAGFLGGLISSTATSVSYAQRSAERPARSQAAALVVTLASAVVFFRVLAELAIVSPAGLSATWAPLTAMTGIMLVVAAGLYLVGIGPTESETEDREPPSDLKSAVMFGLLYGAVLLAVAWAQEHFGESGVYVVAGVSGLTDMDAITLSTAQLMNAGEIQPDTGWRVILVGALANLVFKGGIVASMGSPVLRRRIAAAFGVAVVGGVALLAFWPG